MGARFEVGVQWAVDNSVLMLVLRRESKWELRKEVIVLWGVVGWKLVGLGRVM